MTPQTPPTDRPLTAGDWIEWHGGENPVPGQMVNIRHRGLRDMDDSEWSSDLQNWRHFGAGRSGASDIIAYRLARPATSAASEGEGVVSKSDAIRAVDACGGTYSPDEERSGYADGHREALTAALSALAALASPPVSERERELEGLFAALRDNSWDLRCFNMPTGGDDCDIGWRVVGHWQAEPRERTIAEVFHDDPVAAVRAALTAQPAGEGK